MKTMAVIGCIVLILLWIVVILVGALGVVAASQRDNPEVKVGDIWCGNVCGDRPLVYMTEVFSVDGDKASVQNSYLYPDGEFLIGRIHDSDLSSFRFQTLLRRGAE